MRIAHFPKTLGAIATITVLAVAFVATFDWNWVRTPLAHYLSGKFDRSFAINGDLHGEFSLHPLLTGNDVVLANAAWGSTPALARARQVAVRVDLLSFLHDSPSLPELTLSDATLALERDAQGRENWDFGDHSKTVQIGRLVVDAGAVEFHDRQRGTDLNATVKSAAAGADGQLTIRFDAKGIWEKNDLAMAGTATTPFAANLDDRPYRLDIELHSGTTSGTFAGTFIPAHDKEIDGALALKGQDLSQIDAFLPFEFSRTPPYQLAGKLKHVKGIWSIDALYAKIGQTDLAGRLTIDRREARTLVTADLASQTAHYDDMRALIGTTRNKDRPLRAALAASPGKPGERQSQRRDLAAGSGELSRLKLVDAKIHLKSKHFSVPKMRFDKLNAVADLKDGVLKLHPLEFGLAGGRVTSSVSMDARGKVVKSTADVDVHDLKLTDLVPALKPANGSAGKLSGKAHFTSAGNTVDEMIAKTDGQIALVSAGGNSDSINSGLSHLNMAAVGKRLLRGGPDASIQCAVTSLVVDDGIMTVKSLVINTDQQTIIGHGKIDLARKRYDLRLETDSKSLGLFSFSGPVIVDGTFSKPNVHAESGALLARVGAVVRLGLLNPIAALLPLIDVGDTTNVDCRKVLGKTQRTIDRIDSKDSTAANQPGPPPQPER